MAHATDTMMVKAKNGHGGVCGMPSAKRGSAVAEGERLCFVHGGLCTVSTFGGNGEPIHTPAVAPRFWTAEIRLETSLSFET
jgi:hypothetical protein